MRKEKGITLIALIIMIVVIGVVLFTGFKYAKEYFIKQEKEDIKAEMLAIQGIVTGIKNKHIVDEENNKLVGTKIDLDNNTTEYKITDNLKNELKKQEDAELYILNNEELKKQSIDNTNINETEFYVVDYNSEEVFYSLGIDGKYKLSEL